MPNSDMSTVGGLNIPDHLQSTARPVVSAAKVEAIENEDIAANLRPADAELLIDPATIEKAISESPVVQAFFETHEFGSDYDDDHEFDVQAVVREGKFLGLVVRLYKE